MADDLIRRSDAVRVVDDWYQYGSGRAMLIDSINALPAAAPPPPAESAAEGVTVTRELTDKLAAWIDIGIFRIEALSQALLDGGEFPARISKMRELLAQEITDGKRLVSDLAAAGKAGAK